MTRKRNLALKVDLNEQRLTEKNIISDQQNIIDSTVKPKRKSSGFLRLSGGITAILFAIITGGWWLYQQFTHVFVSDARIAADMISISSRTPGWVTAINITEGDTIKTGELLVTIDDRESRLLVKELEARLAGIIAHREEIKARIHMTDRQTTSKIESKNAMVRAAKAALASAISQRNLAQLENERTEKLAPSGAINMAHLDLTRATLETSDQQIFSARADLENARAALAQAKADYEEIIVLKQQLAGLEPEEQQLRIQQTRAKLDLQDRTITMPFDGVIDRVFVDTGEYVTPGQRLVMVHDPKRVRIEANIKETNIRYFFFGKTIDFTVDALHNQSFEGTISHIGQAATSEFALLPNPNPSGNFIKIVQRLPIRISIQQNGLFKPGMMVELKATINE